MKKTILFLMIVLSIPGCSQEHRATKKLIKNIVNNFNIKHGAQAYEMYSREYVTQNGDYCMYTDGIGYLIDFGDESEIMVDNYSLLYSQIRKSNRTTEWLKTLNYLYKKYPVKEQTDIQLGLNSLLSGFRQFETNSVLSIKNWRNYEYELIEQTNETSECYSIRFFPTKEEESLNYAGIMKINKKSKNLESITFSSFRYYSHPFKTWLISNAEFSFKRIGNQYIIIKAANNYVKDNFHINMELYVTDENILKIELSKEDRIALTSNDINPYINYDSALWSDFKNEFFDWEKLNNDMSINFNKSLSSQFESNKDMPYMKTFSNSSVFTIIGGVKGYQKVSEILEKIKYE